MFESTFDRGEGAGRWLQYTLRALASLPRPPECLVRGDPAAAVGFDADDICTFVPPRSCSRDTSGLRRLAARTLRRLRGGAWEDPGIAAACRKTPIDLWIGFCGFPGLRADRPLLVWYPDFQHEHYPEFFTPQEIAERKRQWEFLKGRATGLLVISRSVAQDALAAGFPAQRVHVAAPRPSFEKDELALHPEEVVQWYGLTQPFFIVCNQFWRHKNHHLVLDALELLAAEGLRPNLVFTGHTHDYRDPEYFDGILGRLSERGLWSRCRILGRVSRSRQLALMRSATAVIQPSLFEGRGLIVEEAQVLGVPVICSRLPVHAEVSGADTRYFDPQAPGELAALIRGSFSPERRSNARVLDESLKGAAAYGRELMAVMAEVGRVHSASRPGLRNARWGGGLRKRSERAQVARG
jgi:glycosyltransferase involved in cell wall biosynthesis